MSNPKCKAQNITAILQQQQKKKVIWIISSKGHFVLCKTYVLLLPTRVSWYNVPLANKATNFIKKKNLLHKGACYHASSSLFGKDCYQMV